MNWETNNTDFRSQTFERVTNTCVYPSQRDGVSLTLGIRYKWYQFQIKAEKFDCSYTNARARRVWHTILSGIAESELTRRCDIDAALLSLPENTKMKFPIPNSWYLIKFLSSLKQLSAHIIFTRASSICWNISERISLRGYVEFSSKSLWFRCDVEIDCSGKLAGESICRSAWIRSWIPTMEFMTRRCVLNLPCFLLNSLYF